MTDATLKAKVTADIAQFTSGMQDVRDSIDRMSGGAVTSAVALVGALAAVAASAIAVTTAAGRQAEELSQLSTITGIGTEALQRYEVLLGRTALGGQDLVLMMRTLSLKMEEARLGTGQAADRFKQLGIDVRTVTDTDTMIRRIAESVSHFASGTEKAAIVADLLGRSGLKFIPAFDGGAAAIDKAAVASSRLGAELSGLQLDVLGRADDQFDDLTLASKRFNQQLGALLAPSIDVIVSGLTSLLSTGSNAFKALDTAADTLAIRFTHVALALREIASTVFSVDALSAGAWEQTLKNVRLIDGEAVKLIARRRELADLGAPKDQRAKPPELLDAAKIAEQAQSAADAALKFSEGLFKNQDALAQANLKNFQTHLDAKTRLSVQTEVDAARQSMRAIDDLSTFTVESLNRQISNYAKFYQQKSALFTNDAAGQAAKQKFEIESSQTIVALLNQLEIAQVQSDTARMQSVTRLAEAIRKSQAEVLDDAVARMKTLDEAQQALFASEKSLFGAADAMRRQRFALIDAEAARQRLNINQNIADETRRAQALLNLDLQTDTRRRQTIQQFPTFFEQQMQAIVASNVFSMGQMVSTWSSGIATMMVRGGNLQAVWEQTQLAIVQAGLNAGIQFLAQAALNAAQELGILRTTQAAKDALFTESATAQVTAHSAMEAAKTTATVTGEAARLGAAVTTAKAMSALMLGQLAAVSALAMGMVALMGVVVGTVVAMMGAIATALTSGVVTSPLAIPVTKAAIGLAIAGGAAVTLAEGAIGLSAGAASAAILSSLAVPAFAKGGAVFGPTLAVVGENATRSNPEFIGHANQLGLHQGTGSITVVAEVDGDTLFRAVARRLGPNGRLQGAFS